MSARLALIALTLLIATSAVADTEVNSCGQELDGNGFLAADLDCSQYDLAVTIDSGVLDLRGFTILAKCVGVNCKDDGRCTIVSTAAGGKITAAPGCAGHSLGVRTDTPSYRDTELVTLDGVEVSGFYNGVRGSRVRISNSTITQSVSSGITATDRILLTNSTVTQNGQDGLTGIEGSSASLYVAKIDGATIADNGGAGVRALKVTVRSSDVSSNGEHGVEHRGTPTMKISDSSVTGNGKHGIFADQARIRAKASTVTGNGIVAPCGVSETCADITSDRMPALTRGAVCEKSYVENSGFPGTSWGVCSLD